MTSMLPAPRDLPPHSRAKIRAELQRAFTEEDRRRRIRYAPITAAVAAIAVVALVVVLAPWQSGTTDEAPPAATTTAPPRPAFPGLPLQEQRNIEAGCGQEAGRGPAQLRNVQTDAAGTFALLYAGSNVVVCTLRSGGKPYLTSSAAIAASHWLPGEFVVDWMSATTGGSSTASGPERKGEPGEIRFAGRVSSKVTRVTVTVDGQTQDMRAANGTFQVRFLYPPTWKIPSEYRGGTVRVYDADDRLIGDSTDRDGPCYRTPDGGYVGPPTPSPVDASKCQIATRWE